MKKHAESIRDTYNSFIKNNIYVIFHKIIKREINSSLLSCVTQNFDTCMRDLAGKKEEAATDARIIQYSERNSITKAVLSIQFYATLYATR